MFLPLALGWLVVLSAALFCDTADAWSNPVASRRVVLRSTAAAALFPVTSAVAATDCFSDCIKNCNLIAPKDSAYCKDTCKAYCEQEDRRDGLSGSVSSDRGEVGILGTQTVVKGEDKPPKVAIPGLDFTSEKGRKLIGY